LIEALATVARDAGLNPKLARIRAERVVALVQGSLVMCRSMGTTRPFANAMRALPDELLKA
jgi:hypothetical protein